MWYRNRWGSSVLAGIVAAALGGGSAEGAVLSGRVTDPQGVGVADVDLDIDDLVSGERIPQDDSTDLDGTYSVTLPEGIYRVIFEPTGVNFAALVVERVDVNQAEIELDVTLQPGVNLTGQVTDQFSNAVLGVDIDVFDSATGSKLTTPGDDTNVFGFYSVVVPPGTYDIEFSAPFATRLVSQRLSDVVVSGDLIQNATLVPGFAYSGTVRSASGAPVFDVDVDMRDLGSGESLVLSDDETDASGVFRLVVPAGTFEVDLEAPPATRLVSQVIPSVSITADFADNYTLDPGFILSGTVFGDGVPLPGVDLDILRSSTLEEVLTPSDFSNALGQYAVVLEADTYDVIVRPPSGTKWDPDTTFAVNMDSDRTLDVIFGTPPPEPTPDTTIALLAPRPNPSSQFTIPVLGQELNGFIAVKVYDVFGSWIDTLFDGDAPAGEFNVTWDGRDVDGRNVAAGIYLVTLESNRGRETKRMIYLR